MPEAAEGGQVENMVAAIMGRQTNLMKKPLQPGINSGRKTRSFSNNWSPKRQSYGPSSIRKILTQTRQLNSVASYLNCAMLSTKKPTSQDYRGRVL
jgi:hypothetical protein